MPVLAYSLRLITWLARRIGRDDLDQHLGGAQQATLRRTCSAATWSTTTRSGRRDQPG
jgi:hypothetical protein